MHSSVILELVNSPNCDGINAKREKGIQVTSVSIVSPKHCKQLRWWLARNPKVLAYDNPNEMLCVK